MASDVILTGTSKRIVIVPATLRRNLAEMSVLEKIDFGLGAAQQEQHLTNYFYRSGSFKLACSDKTYLVLGAKGAGKSAIFRMLQELHDEIDILKPPNMWIADEPQLREHWSMLQAQHITPQITLWRFYTASLIAKLCLDHPDCPQNLKTTYERFLARWGLVREIPTAWQAVKQLKVTVGLSNFVKTEFPPKTALTVAEIDYIIFSANEWLDSRNADLWICLDSLDEVGINGQAASDSEELLSNLMRAVAELIRLKRIRFKLFFRTDIYEALTYVNKDHFSAVKLELTWSKEDLAILLGHRLQSVYEPKREKLDYNTSLQWIDNVFDWPASVVLTSFEKLYESMRDGNGDVLPRDLIQLCINAQKIQVSFDIQGVNQPREGRLISSTAIRTAFVQTTRSKLNDFLQVFQNFKETYDQLKGSEKANFNRAELSRALGKDRLDANFVIADLVRVGALAITDRRSVNQSDAFEIPFLYAIALEVGDLNERI
jgi:hypothetical protein